MAKIRKLQNVVEKNVVEKSTQLDNGQEVPMSENEMQEISEQREQSENEFNFIIIGGNDALLSAAILKVISEQEHQISVFEMDNDEMKFIVNSRAQKKAEETSVEYINNPENKKRIQDWCKILIENFLKNKWKENKFNTNTDEFRNSLKNHLELGETSWMTKKDLKKASNLSWSQFDELFSTLQLFGVVEFDDSGDMFILLIDQNQIIDNKINEAIQMLKLTNGKFASILEDANLNAKQKKTIKFLKIKLSNILKQEGHELN